LIFSLQLILGSNQGGSDLTLKGWPLAVRLWLNFFFFLPFGWCDIPPVYLSWFIDLLNSK